MYRILLQNIWFWFKGNVTISVIMSSNTKDETTSTVNTETRYLGRVKWFNNKTGYGFATIISEDTEGDRVGEDVFVHHSSVSVDSEQYKYLVQGEYVAFNLKESDNVSHPFQANNLAGICGGKLMCETRHEQRLQREQHDGGNDDGDGRDRRDTRGGRDTRGRDTRGGQDGRNGRGRDTRGGQDGRNGRGRNRPGGSGPRDDGKVWALVQSEEKGDNGPNDSQ